MNAVVVLPLVPVMPMTCICSAGWPKNSALKHARARRVLSVKMTGTGASTGSSAMMTAAPFSAAIFAYLWPSAFAPRRQTNAQPGTALRESYTRSVMSTSGTCSARYLMAVKSCFSFIFIPSFFVNSDDVYRHGILCAYYSPSAWFCQRKKRAARKNVQLSHLIFGICGCVVQKTLVQLDAVIAVIDLFLLFERGAVFCTDGDLELTEDGKHAFFRCALLVIVVEL